MIGILGLFIIVMIVGTIYTILDEVFHCFNGPKHPVDNSGKRQFYDHELGRPMTDKEIYETLNGESDDNFYCE